MVIKSCSQVQGGMKLMAQVRTPTSRPIILPRQRTGASRLAYHLAQAENRGIMPGLSSCTGREQGHHAWLLCAPAALA